LTFKKSLSLYDDAITTNEERDECKNQ
jgi:hypothetical protein